eukprot:g2105.t1
MPCELGPPVLPFELALYVMGSPPQAPQHDLPLPPPYATLQLHQDPSEEAFWEKFEEEVVPRLVGSFFSGSWAEHGYTKCRQKWGLHPSNAQVFNLNPGRTEGSAPLVLATEYELGTLEVWDSEAPIRSITGKHQKSLLHNKVEKDHRDRLTVLFRRNRDGLSRLFKDGVRRMVLRQFTQMLKAHQESGKMSNKDREKEKHPLVALPITVRPRSGAGSGVVEEAPMLTRGRTVEPNQ